MTRRDPHPTDAARVMTALASHAMTASEIAFAAGLHPSRVRVAITSLIRSGCVQRWSGIARWHGRGNGTAFTVEEERDVFGRTG